jgi:hypothetical protein
MGVFDPRQGQVLVSPVTEFYRGKAIRQDIADKEQMAELRGLQIEGAKEELARAPEEWAMAKKLAESKQDQVDAALAQSKRDGRWESMQRSAAVLIPWVKDIGALAGENGENSVAAMQKANKTLPAMLEQLSGVVTPEELEKLNKFAGEDRKLDPNEFMMLGKYLESFMKADGAGYKAKDTYIGDDGQEYHMWYDEGGGIHKTNVPAAEDAPLVNMPGAESAFMKNYGGAMGEIAATRQEQANQTYSSDMRLERMLVALGRGAQTGKGESIILDAKQLLSTVFGKEMSPEATEGEIIEALGNQLAMQARNPKGDLGLTGSTSNKDLDFLSKSVAGIQKSEFANILLIDSTLRINKFKRDIANKQLEIIARLNKQGKSVPLHLDVELSKWAEGYELYTDDEQKAIQTAIDGKIESTSLMTRLGLDESQEDDDVSVVWH